MHVTVKFALDPASTPPDAPINRLILKLPERTTGMLVRLYVTGFAYGLAFYLAAWAFALLWIMPPGALFNRTVLFIAATGWAPFLSIYAFCSGWIIARLQRRLELQQTAIKCLEEDFGDVIGETVTMVVNQLQGVSPTAKPEVNLDKYFKR